MSLLDLITGGKSTEASNQEQAAIRALQDVQTPTAAQLTLPDLEKFVQQGILTPEEAKAYLVNSNALDKTSASNEGLNSELSTLSGLQDIVAQGGQDAQEKSDVQKVENDLGTAEHGANAAVLADQARRGTSNSGLTLAAMLAGNQADATNANANALGANANAEARQIAAMTSEGNLGGNVQGQEYAADLNKANAANAIAQFNANQGQNVENENVAAKNAAAASNLQNKQAISNANVTAKQTQQASGTAAQQQAFQDALNKATGVSNATENQANNTMTQGQQQAGVVGGVIGTIGQMASAGMKPPTPQPTPTTMAQGGTVPGDPEIPGVETTANDTVPARLTPHEIVIPQPIADRRDPAEMLKFIRSLPQPQKTSVHPKAVMDVLRALDMHHSEPTQTAAVRA